MGIGPWEKTSHGPIPTHNKLLDQLPTKLIHPLSKFTYAFVLPTIKPLPITSFPCFTHDIDLPIIQILPITSFPCFTHDN